MMILSSFAPLLPGVTVVFSVVVIGGMNTNTNKYIVNSLDKCGFLS